MTETVPTKAVPATPDLPVVIVGAGPAGLATGRALKLRNILHAQLERYSDLGGIWDIDNPGSPMYKSAHFISSRDKSGFFDFPMPKHFADYPTREQILEYTHSLAKAYGLRENIRFNTAVTKATQGADGVWKIETSDGVIEASALVSATGVTWDARLPEVPGHFDDEITHSVGSSRRGYHFMPKHLFGKPADQTEWLPIWAGRFMSNLMRPLVIGGVTRWGLQRPDHKLFESHPLINSQLLHYLQHGDIYAKPGIARIDGSEVVFTDGTRAEVDLIGFATGYDWSMPEGYVPWKAGRPQLYLNAFATTRPGLFGVSYIEVNSSAYTLFDHLANLIAQHLAGVRTNPARAVAFRRFASTGKPDLILTSGMFNTPSAPVCPAAPALEPAVSPDRPLALVTGAAGGIGTGVSRMLARRGYQVIVVDRDKKVTAQAAAAVAPDVIAVACDATDRAAVEALVHRIRTEWAERLEVIVCNAGAIIPGDAADARPADLWLQTDVMLASTLQFLSAAATAMRARRCGHLLATVSMGGILALPGSAAYSAVKAGLRAFLAALSAELTGTGVKVTGVYPSGVDTPMLRHEARHGGSMLNFLGAVYTVNDVVRAYERALDGNRLEVYLPYSESISARLASTVPGWANRLIPLLERLGRKGHTRYLARINAEEAQKERR